MELQAKLSDQLVELIPLKESDFEALYLVASDPLIWEQHPNKDRYKREVFQKYFNSAIESKGAYLILDQKSKNIIGCTRYYEYDVDDSSVAIGFTFIARSYWGTAYNASIKKLMIDHGFNYVNKIYFHVGQTNIRSQRAIEKLGAIRLEIVENDRFTYVLNKTS